MDAEYVFDSNVFINLQRNQPRDLDVYRPVWDKIGKLMDEGLIISSQEVYEEIANRKDELYDWIKERKKCFIPSEIPIQKRVKEILSSHSGLVLGGKKNNNADPFVIALAMEKNCVVVTEEKKNGNLSSPKIPDVCEYYKIECINFIEFLRETSSLN